jgi:hypothetical protein
MPCHGVYDTIEEYWKIPSYFEQQYSVSRHIQYIYLLLAGDFTPQKKNIFECLMLDVWWTVVGHAVHRCRKCVMLTNISVSLDMNKT